MIQQEHIIWAILIIIVVFVGKNIIKSQAKSRPTLRKLKQRLFNDQEVEWEFKWSIATNKTSLYKNGYGIKQLLQQKPQQFQLLSIFPQLKYNIVSTIENWKLVNLSRLFLSDNKIQSVQQLSYMNMPCLQCLALGNNKIVSVKSLRKMLSPAMIWVQLNNNPITESLSVLTQLDAGYLQFVWLQFFENDTKSNDDITWIAKCQSPNLQKFHIKNSSRINIGLVLAKLKQKFCKLDIRYHN